MWCNGKQQGLMADFTQIWRWREILNRQNAFYKRKDNLTLVSKFSLQKILGSGIFSNWDKENMDTNQPEEKRLHKSEQRVRERKPNDRVKKEQPRLKVGQSYFWLGNGEDNNSKYKNKE